MTWDPPLALVGSAPLVPGSWLAWVVTYWAHSAVFILLVSGLRRWRPRSGAFLAHWQRVALLGPLITSSVWTSFAGDPSWDAGSSVTTRTADLSMSTEARVVATSVNVDGGFGWIVAGFVLFGVVVATVRGVRLLKGVARTRRVLRTRRPIVEPALLRLTESIARLARVDGSVHLSHCQGISVPQLVGRREVCLPTELTTVLTRAELRTVIAHEIAHVQRLDWLWFPAFTLLQTLLAFQPLNRWLASAYVSDAEWDCDRRAVEWTSDPQSLAQALVRVAERALAVRSTWVATMASRRGETSRRVQQLVEGANDRYVTHRASHVAPIVFALLLVPWTARFVPTRGDVLVRPQKTAHAVPVATSPTAQLGESPLGAGPQLTEEEQLELAEQRHMLDSELQRRLWVDGEPEDSVEVMQLRRELQRIQSIEFAADDN